MPKSMPQQFGHRRFLLFGVTIGEVHREIVDGFCYCAALSLRLVPLIGGPTFVEVIMLKGSVSALPVINISGQNTQILQIQLPCQQAR